MASALAPSTTIHYNRMFRTYATFCVQVNLPIWPITEDNLVLFSTHMSRRVRYSTIQSYLSGIRFTAIMHHQPFSIIGMDSLYYVLRGIRRSDARHRTPRAPITTLHLIRIHTHLQTAILAPRDKALYWAACTLAFFGLLRVSEYTSPKTSEYDPSRHLLLTDITIRQGNIYVFIKSSKTDPFREGCTIMIGSTSSILCAVKAIKRFRLLRGSRFGPLFTFRDGTYLTRLRLVTFLRDIFTDVNINTHSFRIGGASALSSAGISDAQIKILGRWNSNCFTRYLRLSSTFVTETAQRMVSTGCRSSVWFSIP